MYDDICEYCDGSGHDPDGKGECPMCNGYGTPDPEQQEQEE